MPDDRRAQAAYELSVVKAMGFPGRTVPALKADGRKVQGSRDIARFLDEVKPEPPLFPADSAKRDAVEEAERWGDEELQPVPRRIAWVALGRDHSTVKSLLEGYKLGMPTSVAAATAAPIIWAEKKINKSTGDAVRADLAKVPGLIDHVDELIAQGVIGGAEPNAADFQIAPSVRLLMAFDQLRPLIEGRPAAELATRVVPSWNGHVPAALPADWVPQR